MIVYDGPSQLNGAPIVAILIPKSENRKTGDMAQLYILPKDMSPLEASKAGLDDSVCGDCPLRQSKGGACYVNLGHGPRATYDAYRRGKYGPLKRERGFRRQSVRLGAYGDPAALPYETVKKLTRMFDGHTGYTHQWRTCDQRFKGLLMASADSDEDKEAANARDWRTFRVMGEYSEMAEDERICANDSHGVKCADCLACHGKGGRANIAIKVHGSRKNRFKGAGLALAAV